VTVAAAVPPTASGTVSPLSGVAPLTTNVEGSASKAGSTLISGYQWDCGNSTSVTQQAGTCTYPTAGTYTPKLTVTDADGSTGTWSTTVTVSAPPVDTGGGGGGTGGGGTGGGTGGTPTPNAAPTANLAATPTGGYVGQNVLLDASGSRDTDTSGIATYTFSCGNGHGTAAQAGATTTCSYSTAGDFTAKVTVTDTAGMSGTDTVVVSIGQRVHPRAVLHLSRQHLRRHHSVVANGSGSTAVDAQIVSYRFRCGNGQRSAVLHSPRFVCHFPHAGVFRVHLRVTDSAGLSSTTSKKVWVRR
jgi:PKD repeat protein